MTITRDDVVHVARLARIALREDEIERFQGELDVILEALGKIAELDLADVPPTSHPVALTNVLGPDEPRPSLPLEDALANAPEREGDFFRVPAEG